MEAARPGSPSFGHAKDSLHSIDLLIERFDGKRCRDIWVRIMIRLYRFHQWQANLRILEVKEIKTVPYVPLSHPFVERLIGTIRRECLDFFIPVGECHLKRILREWVAYYNRGRPHSSLGPGIPQPPQAKVPAGVHRHKLPAGHRVKEKVMHWDASNEPRMGAMPNWR